MVAVATLAGAWLAWRWDAHQQVWFGAAAGALLAIALMHLLPDAWADAQDAGLPAWLMLVAAVASFTVTLAVSRAGCACQDDEKHANGAGSAAALALHRCAWPTADHPSPDDCLADHGLAHHPRHLRRGLALSQRPTALFGITQGE